MYARDDTGMGLGFFIAKTLLERSGAALTFVNRTFPERGAVVTVRWPRAEFEQLPQFLDLEKTVAEA
jgi:two-component system sensor histidine kinase RegB